MSAGSFQAHLAEYAERYWRERIARELRWQATTSAHPDVDEKAAVRRAAYLVEQGPPWSTDEVGRIVPVEARAFAKRGDAFSHFPVHYPWPRPELER